jgi:glycosyltransferase involved in cell wall biosynthesis
VSSVRPARVLHVIDGLAGGGSERWVWDIVRLSSPDAVQHRVFTVHPDLGRFVYAERLGRIGAFRPTNAAAVTDSTTRDERQVARLRIMRLFESVPWRLRRALAAPWYVTAVFPAAAVRLRAEERAFRPDMIHAHTFHGLLFGLAYAAVTDLPLLYTVPSLIGQMHDAGFHWAPFVIARARRRVSCFFTAYPSELRELHVSESRIQHLTPAVDLEAIDSVLARAPLRRSEIRERLGISCDATVVLSVGRLHPSKGQAYAVDALSRVIPRNPGVHWVVVGDGQDRLMLAARVRAAGIAQHVHFVGFVEDPLPYYAASDVYLRTTLLEADNLSSIQAMAAGLPVAGFETQPETELVHKVGHGRLVQARDTEALADAIRAFLVDPNAARALGERGRQYCRDHFDLRQVVSMFGDTYRGIFNDRGDRLR